MPICFHSVLSTCGFDRPMAQGICLSRRPIGSPGILRRTCLDSRPRPVRGRRIFCSSELEDRRLLRRCSPLLESALLPSDKAFVSNEWKAVPDIWKSSAEKYGDRIALVDPYHDPPSQLTYKQLEQEILDFSEGLRVAGVIPDEKLALFADNSCRWLVADQGIMATGAINVVRGTRSSAKELLEIYKHSESMALIVDSPEFFKRLAETLIPAVDIRFIILLWGDKSSLNSNLLTDIPVFSYKEVIDLGRESRRVLFHSRNEGRYIYEAIHPDDIATLIYTSGTSGMPKGVMLTHRNLLHQINNLWDIVHAEAGDRVVSMLPPWHAYERTFEYFVFTYGIELVYTTVKNLKDDLKRYQPQYIVSVPLVYEILYRCVRRIWLYSRSLLNYLLQSHAIQKKISTSSALRKFVALNLLKISLLYMEAKRIYEGKVLTEKKNHLFIIDIFDWLWGRIVAAILWPLHNLGMMLVYRKIHSAIGISKAGICGGASLPVHIDKFFEAIGVKVQSGYGLTETSPVVAVRRPTCNVLGSVGHPVQYTEIKIVDSETGQVLPDGFKGIIKVRGPQLMKGYFKNLSATNEVLDKEGWFNTCDIGWIAPENSTGRSRHCGGVLVIEGRAKDTIVLTTGENVEPSELEEAAMRSSLIQQIVVFGQDQRRLGALIVPNKDELLLASKKLSNISANSSELDTDKVLELLRDELTTWTSDCSFQIGPILIVDEPFSIDNGFVTPTMKVQRNRVIAHYSDQIAKLYK